MVLAVLWDYDNTILDTEEAHWKKHQRVLARNGIELQQSFRKRIYENNGSQNWEWMRAELNLKIPEQEYLEAIDTEFRKNIPTLKMRPGVAELLQLFKDLGIPQAIITNARRSSAQPILEKKNISDFMQLILYKEDYQGRKPDPTPYICGLKRLEKILGKEIEPERCLAIEDDPKGAESAYRAGARVIHRKLREEDPDSPHAHYCCFHEQDFKDYVSQMIHSPLPSNIKI